MWQNGLAHPTLNDYIRIMDTREPPTPLGVEALWGEHKTAIQLFDEGFSDGAIAAALGWDLTVVEEMRASRFLEEHVLSSGGNGK